MLPLPDNFRYLNRENRWLDFHWTGLRRADDGALQLLSSPKAVGVVPDLAHAAAPDAPSGIVVDAAARMFFSVPDENRVATFGGCSTDSAPRTCIVGASGVVPLDRPRGLLLLDAPDRLVVADSGNHRVLFFDLATFEVRDVWGQDDVASNPRPGTEPGRFNTPWSVAADAHRNVYVLDYGNRRIQKFRDTGEPDAGFAQRLAESGLVDHPGALAVIGGAADVNVFVFDIDAAAIFVFDAAGTPRRETNGHPIAIRHAGMTDVRALTASATTLYAGDNHLRRVLAFQHTPSVAFAGEAAGFDGPVAALAMEPSGGIALAPGGSAVPVRMSAAGAYLPRGVLWSNAISSGASPAVWNRLRADVTNVAGAHVEFFYAIANDATTPHVHAGAPIPFSDPAWQRLPNDVDDFLLAGPKASFLFVGAIFTSDRSATARLKQMRADFDDPGYLRYLPSIYRQPPAEADFTERVLRLFQSVFDDVEAELEGLARYFNPNAVPADGLPWLATWLAVELDQDEPLARIRAAIAGAFRRDQWRGTAEGLKRALLEDAGVHANIVQPIADASFWSFAAETSCSGTPSTDHAVRLGANAALAGMQPGGAVLGSTAQLDGSYLISDAEFGEPLFDGSAYQFVVEVFRSEVDSPRRVARVREIVERERPAHSMWRLSVLEPSMRIGVQARAGIDSIVGGAPGPSGLGEAGSSAGFRLAGRDSPRVGVSRLGRDLTLEQ